jgi:hypothetical protein
MNRVWSDEERNFIRNNAGEMKDLEIARQLSQTAGRIITLQAVRKQRQKMGLRKKPGRGVCAVDGKANRAIMDMLAYQNQGDNS